jgi:outer membrane lipoprotein-sorting protein
MSRVSTVCALTLLLAIPATARAQTADEVIEKTLTALGGRAALGKVTSRSMTGTIVVSTPAGEITGTMDVLNAVPNKTRSLMKADLSALGAGELVIDQRFNGTAGYVIDTLQGNREVSGNQLENQKNGAFPHPFLTDQARGITAQLGGKEKIGDRDVYVLVLTPKAGSVSRTFIDAQTYLPIKVVTKVVTPQAGEVEQTSEFADYRDIDGLKIPFKLTNSSAVQSFTISFTKVEHNVVVDEALFSKPGGF